MRYPEDFPSMRSTDSTALGQVVCSSNREGLEPFVQKGFSVRRIQFGGCELFVALRGLKWNDPPRKRSPGSAAEYLAEFVKDNPREGKTAEALQYIPPDSKTSSHRHDETIEMWCILAGMVYLYTAPRRPICLAAGGVSVAEPGIPHQLTTAGTPVLTLMRMVGPDPLGSSDHHPCKSFVS